MVPLNPTLPAIIRQQPFVAAVLLVVMLLALFNWILSPEEALRWLRVMLVLPGLWLAMSVWHLATLKSRRRCGIDDDSAVIRYFASAMALVFIAIGFVQIVKLGIQASIAMGGHAANPDVDGRIVGLAVSAVFIFIGNALPKILTPLSMLSREQAELVTTARRFVGRVFVVFGLVTALAFLMAPVELAAALLKWATGGCLLTILGAVVWMNVAPNRRKQ
jgi:hypothetical protein